MWEHFLIPREREWLGKAGELKLLSVKPPLVLITASCLYSCRVLQSAAEEISGTPVPPPPYTQTFRPPAATQEAKAHPHTLVKQWGATGPEGEDTVWEKENNGKETNAITQTKAHLHKHRQQSDYFPKTCSSA